MAEQATKPTMPSRGHSTAPRFIPTEPRELPRYFEELDNLFRKCDIKTAPEKKKFACLYVDIDTSNLWSSLPEHEDAVSFEAFVKAVITLYPGAEDERKWSIADMDKLVGERLRIGINSSIDLGDYYRTFYTITQYLLKKDRISEAEQSRAFKRGFQRELWALIARRLELKKPDHFPDDPYKLEDILNAAKFILHGTSPITLQFQDTLTSPPIHAPPSSSSVKQEDLTSFFDKFASTLLKALASQNIPSASTNPTRSPYVHPDGKSHCNFCGGTEHFIRDCKVVERYIEDGKVRRNGEGRIILSSGAFVPRNIPGEWLANRVDEWHRRNPGQLTTAKISSNANSTDQLIYQLHSLPAPAVPNTIPSSTSTYQLSAAE